MNLQELRDRAIASFQVSEQAILDKQREILQGELSESDRMVGVRREELAAAEQRLRDAEQAHQDNINVSNELHAIVPDGAQG